MSHVIRQLNLTTTLNRTLVLEALSPEDYRVRLLTNGHDYEAELLKGVMDQDMKAAQVLMRVMAQRKELSGLGLSRIRLAHAH